MYVAALGSTPVVAQATPLHTASTAAPPPDLSAFFPLGLGTMFDYEADTGAVLRRSISRDSLVGTVTYAVVEDTVWDRAGRRVGAERHLARFDPDAERVVVWDGSRERMSSDLSPCPLVVGESLDCVSGEGTELRHATETEGPLPLDPGLQARTRTYASEVGFGVLVLTEGVGPTLVAGLDRVYALRYARVGGRELGTPLRPLRPAPAAPLERRLRVWPNPAAGPVTVQYEGAEAGPATAEVFDALGRRVLVVPLPPSGDVRRVAVDLSGAVSPGAYTVRVRGGAGGGVVARFVKL